MEPCSKLATARALNPDTVSSSLGEVLGVAEADVDDLYEALDWPGRGQKRIERKLARRHLEEGELLLWDVTTLPFASRTSALAAYGRPKGGKSQRQVLFGLLTTAEGVPVGVEVFAGNTGDPATVGAALERRVLCVAGDLSRLRSACARVTGPGARLLAARARGGLLMRRHHARRRRGGRILRRHPREARSHLHHDKNHRFRPARVDRLGLFPRHGNVEGDGPEAVARLCFQTTPPFPACRSTRIRLLRFAFVTADHTVVETVPVTVNALDARRRMDVRFRSEFGRPYRRNRMTG